MSRSLRTSMLLALFGALAVPAAHAFPSGAKTWTACGGNAFNTCASVQLGVVGNVMTVKVKNYSGTAGTFENTVFTGVGFDNLPLATASNGATVTSMTGAWYRGLEPAAWKVHNDTQIGGGVNLDMVGQTSGGVSNGIASDLNTELPRGKNRFWLSGDASGWVTFSFTIRDPGMTSAQLQTALDNTTLLVKGQNGPDGASTQLICPAGECGITVTPEPVTMMLLGSGLAGLGLVGRRRGRREEEAGGDDSEGDR